MTAVELINCPYDSGRRDWRCGLGPRRILQHDAVARIQALGAHVALTEIETEVSYECEGDLSLEAQRQIAKCVADARAAGRLPLVLGGNCNTAVGAVSGMASARLGVVWFDAHGDFCTPDTTDSGFLDGMGLAMLVGRGWRRALSTIPGYTPVPENATALVGGRDFDPWEVEDLAASAITQLRVEDVRTNGVQDAFEPFLETLRQAADEVYLHIDLDVHDPEDAPTNFYNAPGGLRAEEVRQAIALIGRHVPIAGGGLASYDPAYDPDGRTADIAVGVLEALIAASPQAAKR